MAAKQVLLGLSLIGLLGLAIAFGVLSKNKCGTGPDYAIKQKDRGWLMIGFVIVFILLVAAAVVKK